MGNNYVLDGVPVFTVEVGDAIICFFSAGCCVVFVQCLFVEVSEVNLLPTAPNGEKDLAKAL